MYLEHIFTGVSENLPVPTVQNWKYPTRWSSVPSTFCFNILRERIYCRGTTSPKLATWAERSGPNGGVAIMDPDGDNCEDYDPSRRLKLFPFFDTFANFMLKSVLVWKVKNSARELQIFCYVPVMFKKNKLSDESRF